MAATASTPRARALSAALREARTASGIGLRELARQLDISHTQVSHWETGHRVPDVEVVAMILAALRVSSAERERILDLARNVREPNWLTVGLAGIPQQLAGVVENERAASAIVQWSPMALPGLLQTANYSRAIMEANRLPQHEVDLRVMVRLGRSEVITRSRPVRFSALVSEAAVREVIGGATVMAAQLRYLADMGQRPNVHLRIVPLGVGWHPGWSGPFVLYEFPDAPPVLHFEHYSSGAFIPARHDVAEYRRGIEMVEDVALSEEETTALLTKITKELENAP